MIFRQKLLFERWCVVGYLFRCGTGGTAGCSGHTLQVLIRHREVILASSLCQGRL